MLAPGFIYDPTGALNAASSNSSKQAYGPVDMLSCTGESASEVCTAMACTVLSACRLLCRSATAGKGSIAA